MKNAASGTLDSARSASPGGSGFQQKKQDP
jgi:hypothetical protein